MHYAFKVCKGVKFPVFNTLYLHAHLYHRNQNYVWSLLNIVPLLIKNLNRNHYFKISLTLNSMTLHLHVISCKLLNMSQYKQYTSMFPLSISTYYKIHKVESKSKIGQSWGHKNRKVVVHKQYLSNPLQINLGPP